MLLCSSLQDTDSVSLLIAVTNVAVGASDMLQYPPCYPIDVDISRYAPRLDASGFAMVPVLQPPTVIAGNENCEVAYTGAVVFENIEAGTSGTKSSLLGCLLLSF